MPNNSVRHEMDERKMRELRKQLLRTMTDEDAERVCVRCGCVFRPTNDKIVCPFCGLEYVPTIE